MAGKITALQVQKNDKERVNIYIEGEFAFGLNILDAANLRKGQYLSDDEIARLQSSDQAAKAFNQAVRYLGRRPRSEREIENKLKEKGNTPEVIVQVIQRLQQLGYINDEEFARYWVRNREEFRPRGPMALRAELREKGISNTIIDEILSDFEAEDSARRAAEKKARSLQRFDEQTFRHKLTGFLARRGFRYETVRTVVDELVTERAFEDEADEADDEDKENPEYFDL